MAISGADIEVLESAALVIPELIKYSRARFNIVQGSKDLQRPAPFQLLHRLPIEIRLRIFEFAILATTPSPLGILAKVNPAKCRCPWLVPCNTVQQIRNEIRALQNRGPAATHVPGVTARTWVRSLVYGVLRGCLWSLRDGKVVDGALFAGELCFYVAF